MGASGANRAIWGLLITAALLAAPAGSQTPEKPKSLLPPGFDALPQPAAAAPAPLLPGVAPPAAPAQAESDLPPLLPDAPSAGAVPTPAVADPYAARAALPPGAPIGVFPANTPGGFGETSFAGSNGRFLAALAARITRPVASRWAAITLRRALLARVPGPRGIGDGDWVAVRAGLLLRQGEVDGARRLIDVLPVDRFTPATYAMAAQVSLAAADIAGLCPIAATGRALNPGPLWDLAFGMCAAMESDDLTSANIIDVLRNQRRVAPFDVRLAQRVAMLAGGAGSRGRADGVNWEEVEGLTIYRYGVATAAGVPVPGSRLAALGPAHAGWVVRNPAVSAETRLALLRAAAMQGNLSSAELASGVSALSPADASGGFAAGSRAANLRDAFTAGTPAGRAAAMATIRASVTAGGDPYGALLETATAAAALRPVTALSAEAPAIIAALLAAGNERAAARWWPVASAADDDAKARAWALLAVGSGVSASVDEFKDWRSRTNATSRSAGMLLAALSGLGAAKGNDWDGLRRDLIIPATGRWNAAITSAGRRGAAGEVALLAATGLQGGWADVPPAHVEAIVAALVASGRRAEARQFAAEAVTRAGGGLPV
jgi:hypothetical protein